MAKSEDEQDLGEMIRRSPIPRRRPLSEASSLHEHVNQNEGSVPPPNSFAFDVESFLRRHAECPQCKKRYEDPRTLPCLDSFCKNCLEEIAIQQREEREAAQRRKREEREAILQEQSGHFDRDESEEEDRDTPGSLNPQFKDENIGNFTCPRGCEGDTGITVRGDDDHVAIDGLPPLNNFLNNLIHTFKLKENLPHGVVECQNCDRGTPAIAVCNNAECANKPLCPDCLSAHLLLSKTKMHQVIHANKVGGPTKEGEGARPDPKASLVTDEWKCFPRRSWPCHKHPEHPVNRYCYQHNEVICRDCSDIGSGHRNCPNVELVDDCMDREVGPVIEKLESADACHEKIKQSLEDIKMMKARLNENREVAIKSIEEHCAGLVKSLEEQRDDLIEQSNKICLQKMKELDKEEDRLNRVSETFARSTEFIRGTLNTAIPAEFMFLKESFNNRLQFLVDRYHNYHRLSVTIDTTLYLYLNKNIRMDGAIGEVCGSHFVEAFTIRNFPPQIKAEESYKFSIQCRDISTRQIRGTLPNLKATIAYTEEDESDDYYMHLPNEGALDCYIRPHNETGTYTVIIHPTMPGRHKVCVFHPQPDPLNPLYVRGCPLYVDVAPNSFMAKLLKVLY